MEYPLLAWSESSADKFIRKSVPTGRKQAGVGMYLSWQSAAFLANSLCSIPAWHQAGCGATDL